MEWYYASNGQQLGPVSQEKLVELFLSGQVKPTDLVWASHLPTWTPLQQVSEITSAAQAAAPAPQPAPPAAKSEPEPQPAFAPEPPSTPTPAQDYQPAPESAPTTSAPESVPQTSEPAPFQQPETQAPAQPTQQPAVTPPTSQVTPPVASAAVNSYLWQSIVLMVMCCLPLGVMGLISALKVGPAIEAGDLPAAEAASASAKKWCLITLIAGVLLNVLIIGGWFVWLFAMGGAQMMQNQ